MAGFTQDGRLMSGGAGEAMSRHRQAAGAGQMQAGGPGLRGGEWEAVPLHFSTATVTCRGGHKWHHRLHGRESG